MKTTLPEVLVLYGGSGPEREISLRSGKAVYNALKSNGTYPLRLYDWNGESIKDQINPRQSIVFPALHGSSGEDGTVQKMLEDIGVHYAGSDSTTSSICIDKVATKKALNTLDIDLAKQIVFGEQNNYNWSKIKDFLGIPIVVKPIDSGSSFGLVILNSENDFIDLKENISLHFPLLLESYLPGLDLTIGVVSGCPRGVIGIEPIGGYYDYAHKYQMGKTYYQCPAKIPIKTEKKIRLQANEIVSHLRIRDFCRIDFKEDSSGNPVFLEVNTLPGLTETSLLPKSLACEGTNFEELCLLLLEPAVERFLSAE